jgi:hypothetical protein
MQTEMNRLSGPRSQSDAGGRRQHCCQAGATEQHGPHLPLGTDALLANAVAEGVAQKVGGIVAPALPMASSRNPSAGAGSISGTTSRVRLRWLRPGVVRGSIAMDCAS